MLNSNIRGVNDLKNCAAIGHQQLIYFEWNDKLLNNNRHIDFVLVDNSIFFHLILWMQMNEWHANEVQILIEIRHTPNVKMSNRADAHAKKLTLFLVLFQPLQRNVIRDFAYHRRVCFDFPMDKFEVSV